MKYATQVVELFEGARYAGPIAPANGSVLSAMAGKPSWRGLVQFRAVLDSDRTVVHWAFKAFGCPATIACAEYVSRFAHGKKVSDLNSLEPRHLLETLQLPLTRYRAAWIACAAARRLAELPQ